METLNEIKAVFTNWKKGENWVHGTVGKYTFESKLFDEVSTFGIQNGRVSKLSIYDDKLRQENRDFLASCIVNYDRGWDIRPSKENKPYFKAVMKLLENSPKDRFTD